MRHLILVCTVCLWPYCGFPGKNRLNLCMSSFHPYSLSLFKQYFYSILTTVQNRVPWNRIWRYATCLNKSKRLQLYLMKNGEIVNDTNFILHLHKSFHNQRWATNYLETNTWNLGRSLEICRVHWNACSFQTCLSLSCVLGNGRWRTV